MNPRRDLVGVSLMLDANCVNARQKNIHLNYLEVWARQGLIDLITAETAQSEMAFGKGDARKKKAHALIFSMSEDHTEDERVMKEQIGKAIFPDGVVSVNQRNDVDIVFNAQKYQRPLITMDGDSATQPRGILGSKAELKKLGVVVMSPSEAVEYVKSKIEARDSWANQWAEHTGNDLPDWVGKD